MSFMEAQITDKQHWVMVDGNCGIDYIPAELIDLGQLQVWLGSEADDAMENAFALLCDYTENKEAFSIEIVEGYGVRSSAAGYMDCTPWEVYTNKREAMGAYREHARECRGDE